MGILRDHHCGFLGYLPNHDKGRVHLIIDGLFHIRVILTDHSDFSAASWSPSYHRYISRARDVRHILRHPLPNVQEKEVQQEKRLQLGKSSEKLIYMYLFQEIFSMQRKKYNFKCLFVQSKVKKKVMIYVIMKPGLNFLSFHEISYQIRYQIFT